MSGGLTRELQLADSALLQAISRHLDERMTLKKPLKPNDPLLLSQKGGFYSPNTLQNHMATMLREWSGMAGESAAGTAPSAYSPAEHGKLMFLAFLIDQVLESFCRVFGEIRQHHESRRNRWERLRAAFTTVKTSDREGFMCFWHRPGDFAFEIPS